MAVSGSFMKMRSNQSFFRTLEPLTAKVTYRKQLFMRTSRNNTDGEERTMTSKESDGQTEIKIVFSGEKLETPLLDTVSYPVHMKNLSLQDLEELAGEVRAELLYSVSKSGGC